MIQPTLGRIVHYRPVSHDRMLANKGALAAIVVRVWNDRLVNLTVFDQDGGTHSRLQVHLVQPGETPPAVGAWCEWPPRLKPGRVKPRREKGLS